MADETYNLDIHCYNCNLPISLGIKEGLSLREYLAGENEKCPRCKCILPSKYY